MPRKRTTPKRDKAGRPPRVFTETQKRKIDRMALAQARDTTIALAMGVDVHTFKEHFLLRCQEKRAEGKLRVLNAQFRAASSSKGSTVDRIWWGKQHLEQTDKQQLDHGVTDAMGELMKELDGTAFRPGNSKPVEDQSA